MCKDSSALKHNTHRVTGKPERPQLRLEVPDHHRPIKGPRDQLLEVAVERHGRDRVLVAPE